MYVTIFKLIHPGKFWIQNSQMSFEDCKYLAEQYQWVIDANGISEMVRCDIILESELHHYVITYIQENPDAWIGSTIFPTNELTRLMSKLLFIKDKCFMHEEAESHPPGTCLPRKEDNCSVKSIRWVKNVLFNGIGICNKCGRKGHLQKDCIYKNDTRGNPIIECMFCGVHDENHVPTQCTATHRADGTPIIKCSRCKYPGHTEENCKSKTSFNGIKLATPSRGRGRGSRGSPRGARGSFRGSRGSPRGSSRDSPRDSWRNSSPDKNQYLGKRKY